ncbi:TonB-dependent receptor [Robiginitalea marina]|uniref:TonB-dependent receptor n=1 Tax=Robiginitalea marina TaxID=2954105 RepID=A0ABT1ATU2_9FLAO|nr:TonB-dependent receptor [Robiginitalea marina]MCO5723279.1 TonB-dependent receptor [Robiginitalea marina]
MRIPIALVLLVLFQIPAIAQQCQATLSGRVLDFHDQTPLAGATVLVLGQQKAALTDLDGRYRIEGLCEGDFEVELSHPQCLTLLYNLEIKGETRKDFEMEHHLEELEEVQVFGDILADQSKTGQEQRLSTRTLEDYSSASLGDALRTLSGVSSLNTGSNIVKPAIGGLTGSRVLILNDGVRMQDMEWGDEHAPNIDINSADQVSVVKGAAALKYAGDAIGGLVIIERERIAVKDSLYGKTLLNYVSNGRGGSASTELTRTFASGWYLNGQASYKKLGDREAPDYILSNTGMQEVGLSLHTGKRLLNQGWDLDYSFYRADIAVLRASHIGNIDDLIGSINSGEPSVVEPFTYDLGVPRQEVTHHLAKAGYYLRIKGLGKWTAQYDFQNNRRFEYDVRVGADRNKPAIDLELTTHTLMTDFTWDSSRDLKVMAGVLGRFQDNFANPDTGVRRLIPDYQKYDLGGFLTGEYRFGPDWLVEAGLRYDYNRIDAQKFYRTSRWEERGYDEDFADIVVEDLGTQLLTNPVLDFHNLSATAGARRQLDAHSELRANYAFAQRPPNPAELFSDGLHHSAARIELGDLRIGNETSHRVSLAYEREGDRWGLTLEPYLNHIQDFILLEPTGVEFTIRGAFPVWSYRQTDARLLGFDASGYYRWSAHWESQHRFSLVRGKELDQDVALINMPAPITRNTLIYRNPSWKGLEVGLESTYVFRQNEFPPNISVFSPSQQEEVVLEINTPPDAYHLLGLRAGMQFPLGKGLNLSSVLTVENLLNTRYREYLNRQRYFADDLGRNIILQLKLNY